MIGRCLALLLAGLLACSAPTGFVPVPPVRPWPMAADVLHYDIEIDIDHEAGYVDGSVNVRLRATGPAPLTEVALDAVELLVQGVWDDRGRELAFTCSERMLRVQLARPLPPGDETSIEVDYACFPRRGLYFVPPRATRPATGWHIWTQGEAEETRHWMPVRDRPDDRATHRLTLTLDDAFSVQAAGRRVRSRSDPGSGRRTETWEMDTAHVSYLISLTAGDLAAAELGGGPVPLPVLAEPAHLPRALENLSATADILAFLAEATGRPYPYGKYAQSCVREFVAGGMENVTATTLWYGTLHEPADEPQADPTDLLAHEAAHSWFGNLITCRDWRHLWLNEGFATYYEARYLGHVQGQDRFRRILLDAQASAVAAEQADAHPIVWDGYGHPDDAFNDHVYPGGATRLHLLRFMLGAEAFDAAVRYYVQVRADTVVESEDVRRALEASSGVDLRRFFDEWLYGGGYPCFSVELADAPGPAAQPGLRRPDGWLRVRQTQGQRGWRDVFHLPVAVAWSRNGSEHRALLELADREASLELTGEGPLDWVRFDADTSVPMELVFDQPEARWRSQLRGARDGVTRLLAASHFVGPPEGAPALQQDTRTALIEAVERDPFVDVRVAALHALADCDDDRVPRLLVDALASPDPRVREAAALGLALQGGDEVLASLTGAADDPNGSVLVAALSSLVQRRFPGAFTLLAERVRRHRGLRWPIARDLLQLCADLDDERVLPLLLGQAATHPAPQVRAAAVDTLAGHAAGPHATAVFAALSRHLDGPAYEVREAAAGALGQARPRGARLQLRARRAVETHRSVLVAIDEALARW